MQVFIASASFSGYIISIFADNGLNGAPGTLLRTDTIPFSQVTVGGWNTVNYAVPIGVSTGGYYVAWMMGGADMFIGTEDVGPISRRSYEVLGGAWSGFRDNNLRELMIRVNIGGYPCALNAAYNTTGNLNTVTFTNQSTGGTSYLWTFGDGGTSTALSPSHTYAVFGTYNVCLIATNGCGSDTICMPVAVTCPTPNAAFNNVRTGFNVQFSDISSSSPSAWAWTFGDGGTSTLQNPSHLYAAPGTYNVCLITTNTCGSDTTCQSVTVCAQPVSIFTFTTNQSSATFTNTSTNGTTSFWSFGDGVNSTQASPTHVYPSPGTYTACLVTYNACYTDTLCLTVTICPLPLPSFNVAPNNFIYAFTDITPGVNTAWAWTFGDGGTSTVQNPTHTYAANGTYNVCLEVTNSCGNDSSCQTLVVNVVGVADGLDGSLQLWPNPARNQLKVSLLLPGSSALDILVRDMAGRLVHQHHVQVAAGTWSTQMDISSLAAGMYMLEIQGQDLHAMRKFVKE